MGERSNLSDMARRETDFESWVPEEPFIKGPDPIRVGNSLRASGC